MLPHYIHSVNYLPNQFCGALRRAACPAGIGFEFCGYCEKAVISLMKWPKSREKPPWMAVLRSMGTDAHCFWPVRSPIPISISLVKSAFFVQAQTQTMPGGKASLDAPPPQKSIPLLPLPKFLLLILHFPRFSRSLLRRMQRIPRLRIEFPQKFLCLMGKLIGHLNH